MCFGFLRCFDQLPKRPDTNKPLQLLGVDFSLQKASERLGVDEDVLLEDREREFTTKTNVARENVAANEIISCAAPKARSVLGEHEPSSVKLKRWLDIDERELARRFDENRERFVHEQLCKPQCERPYSGSSMRKSQVLATVPRKAQQLIGFDRDGMSREKLRALLGTSDDALVQRRVEHVYRMANDDCDIDYDTLRWNRDATTPFAGISPKARNILGENPSSMKLRRYGLLFGLRRTT